jgi:hypothetical protein
VKLDNFLSHIFDKVNQTTQGVVVTASKGDGFESRRWRPGRDQPYDDLYFCVSTVANIPRQTVLSRKAADLVLSWVVVLDDIGTKVDPDLIKLKPTYKLRTSPGNQQWGFKLSYPIEPGQFAALMEAIAAAGLTDPGAIRADRIMRVPGSINHKYERPFEAVLEEESWDVTYSWTELATGLGVTVGEAREMGSLPPPLPPGKSDPLYDWQQEQGRVRSGPSPSGWYEVVCPQQDQHTGDTEHGTGYHPGNPGGFKCLHAHCQDLTTADLRAFAVSTGTFDDAHIQPAAIAALAAALAPARALLPPEPAPRPTQNGIAPTRLAGRLAAHIREIELWPGDLPDADRTPADAVNMRQATTASRVEHVMDAIGLVVRLNTISQQIEATLRGYEGDLTSGDVLDVLHHAAVRCGMRDKEAIRATLVAVAQNDKYSPVVEWVEAVEWDGKSRLQELYDTVVMRDPALNGWRDMAIRRWCIQCVTGWYNYRLTDPEQLRMCLTLQGAQNIGKSRWFNALLPPGWVTIGASLRLDSPNERDVVKKATRTPITELGELDSIYRKADMAALRNFLSTTVDTYRMPYDRTESVCPRTTSFGATVNPEGFLVDQTGETRFLPLAVARCEPEHDIELQQLWAEIAEIDEQHWLTPAEAAVHATVTAGHKATNELSHALEDIAVRVVGNTDRDSWVHVSPLDVLNRYSVRSSPKAFADLSAALEFAGHERTRIKGRNGYWLPNLNATLTAAQLAGLKLVKTPEK